MRLIKVAAAVLNTTPLAWEANRTAIVEAIHEARRQQVSILCLPELCITGYGCEDAFLSNGTQAMAQKLLLELLPETTGMGRLVRAAVPAPAPCPALLTCHECHFGQREPGGFEWIPSPARFCLRQTRVAFR